MTMTSEFHNKLNNEQVACSRYNGPSPATTKAKIINLIQDGTCYVPLIRSDTSAPYAKVGDPYTPTSPYKLVSEIEESFYPMVDADASLRDLRNMKVWAFAGPMSPQEAEDFKREWKSPRMKRHDRSHRDNLKIVDGDRGFERFGRELADVHSTSWQEYWPFLDAFADLRSEKGLEKLENFFEKQRTVISMQTFLKSQTDFVEAPPYQVGQQFILKQSAESKLDDSGGEDNTAYISAESSNETDEKWGSPEASVHDLGKKCQPNKLGKDLESQVKSPGMFSSLWSGFSRIKNYLSPRANPTQHHSKNAQSGTVEGVVAMGTNQESSQTTVLKVAEFTGENKSCEIKAGETKSDEIKSGKIKLDETKSVGIKSGEYTGESKSGDACVTPSLPKDSDSAIQQINNNGVNNIPDTNVAIQTDPDLLTSNSGASKSGELKGGEIKSSENKFSETKSGDGCVTPNLHKDSALQQKNISGVKNFPDTNIAIQTEHDSLTSNSNIESTSDPQSSDSLLMSSKILDLDNQSSSITWEPATGRSLIFSSQSHLDISRSPRHWKYRSSKHSIESPEKSPDKDFRSSSPSSGRRHPGKKSRSDTHHCSIEGALASCAKQSDSFNIKMDSICKNLEKFTIMSPERSSSLSFEFSSDLEDFDLVLDPKIHIFTGKVFAKFTAQLTSYKSSSSRSDGADLLPIVSLRQDQDNETILADVFLPDVNLCSSLVQLKGPIMDEHTHKEIVKNVWVNFLTIYPLSEDAKRICNLAKDEIMTAVIEGLPEDKDTFGYSRNLRSDSKSLKELFFHCQNSIEENSESLTTKIRVLRSETVPNKDVFVCGSIPTKMDADVYNTLNLQSCQLICNQSFRFPLCKQWLDHMDKPGKEFINNLPTPSRILRQERWELPPFSPLVTSSTPITTDSRPHLPNLTSTPKTTKESLRENPVVKNLFASEFKADE